MALVWQINGYDFTGETANLIVRAASLPCEPMTDSTRMSLQVCNKERWQVFGACGFPTMNDVVCLQMYKGGRLPLPFLSAHFPQVLASVIPRKPLLHL